MPAVSPQVRWEQCKNTSACVDRSIRFSAHRILQQPVSSYYFGSEAKNKIAAHVWAPARTYVYKYIQRWNVCQIQTGGNTFPAGRIQLPRIPPSNDATFMLWSWTYINALFRIWPVTVHNQYWQSYLILLICDRFSEFRESKQVQEIQTMWVSANKTYTKPSYKFRQRGNPHPSNARKSHSYMSQ